MNSTNMSKEKIMSLEHQVDDLEWVALHNSSAIGGLEIRLFGY